MIRKLFDEVLYCYSNSSLVYLNIYPEMSYANYTKIAKKLQKNVNDHMILFMSQKAIVVITGVKLTESKHAFNKGQTVTYLYHDNLMYKMNAAAGCVYRLEKDYEIICTGYNKHDAVILEKLGLLSRSRFYDYDMTIHKEAALFASKVKKLSDSLQLPVHVIHYGGASDTKVRLPNNSLLAHTWDMKIDAVVDLVKNNVVAMVNLLQAMNEVRLFKHQPFTKVVLISAAAAVRAKQKLGLDTIQKGAGHSLARTLALDLTQENIFITEIMPGSTDTGFFDNEYTMNTACAVTKNLGYDVTPETYPVFTAEQIGDAAKYVMDANCNVREIVLLPYGQFPHLGA